VVYEPQTPEIRPINDNAENQREEDCRYEGELDRAGAISFSGGAPDGIGKRDELE
jgi:hypothetical protein